MSDTDLATAAALPALPVLRQDYAAACPELSVPWRAHEVPEPTMLALNEELASELGLDAAALRTPEGIAWLTGQREDVAAATTAQAYAGHQFGQANPRLGDGRALLLGEVTAPDGSTVDLHLKGSGPTPFSRAGDGLAPLGPMLRELVIGEFLHAAGVPTTRALAVIGTGQSVRRQGVHPGAILVRAAASHLRVGTVQYAAWHHGPEATARLVNHAAARHAPQALCAPVPALALLAHVVQTQAELVAQWMLLGFVHGVMNTDNMTLSGQSIDFGPCAFLDVHRSDAVFSSIDAQGRYAYRNQPGIALWNLSRLAEALLAVIDSEDPQAAVAAATDVLEGFEPAYRSAWTTGMAAKLGIALADPTGSEGANGEAVRELGEDLLGLLERAEIDHTGFFRALTEDRAAALFGEEHTAAYAAWEQRLHALRAETPPTPARSALAVMAQVNPVVIPRNHHLDAALADAERGDLAPIERLLAAVRDPFTHHPDTADLEGPGGDSRLPFVTYCGT